MNPEEMKQRTRQFALRVIKLVQSLPDDRVARTLGQQLLRSGTSVGANYRAACRARSDAEFRAKLGIVEEEGDESAYWIELLIDSGIVSAYLLENILQEADELVAIVVASIKTSKQKK
ncbi:MAG: four helix bundle protein [Planctomycetes bacterium]|nr:four helix bundle protein [Planctomycetota bacterium]